MIFNLLKAGLLLQLVGLISAFQSSNVAFRRSPVTILQQTAGGAWGSDEVEALLAEEYPEFNALLSKNEAVWKALKEATGGFTIFAPNRDAFGKLGDKKQSQLKDPRNGELTEKIGAYHIITEPVTDEQLFESGGVITLGGEVPTFLIGGGLFGFFGKGDESDTADKVTINGAKVVKTMNIGDCVVHEVDALVSPRVLWRYADQLRIPGSS